jgi:hypothetical protein
MISLKQVGVVGSILASASAAQAASAQSSLPKPVRGELDRLLADCRIVGGNPKVNTGAVSKAALIDDRFADHIIWTGEIECHGALTAFGGIAGQALVLVPSSGRGIRQVYAHTWKLVGDGPMTVEIVGGMDCAMGHGNRCVSRLSWTGSAFAPVSESPRIQLVNQETRRGSIVGDWAENRDACASAVAGRIRIGPKSLASDEISCTFASVARAGSTVTWRGSCNEGRGPSPATVLATESGGRLTIKFPSGNAWGPLMRCSRQ